MLLVNVRTTSHFKIIELLHPPSHTNHLQSCPQQFKGKNWPEKSVDAYPFLVSDRYSVSLASHASRYYSTSMALTEAEQKPGILFSDVP